MALTDRAISDDLYIKIALDNKLVSKFQVRKASKEQQDREAEGDAGEIGPLMVELGFLTDRQHRSVLNACTYREQRDFDKRFGRQCLRMNLLNQDRIEEALAQQKKGYMDSGSVTPLSEVLVEQGAISTQDVEDVEEGIRQRDAARARALADRARQVSSGSQRIPGHTTKGNALPATDVGTIDDADLDDADLDDVDLDDADLDDVDLDDADLDDVDLDEVDDDDDADLDDADLDDVDLDDVDDADLESDLDDVDDADLDEVDDDDADLDDADLDDADLDDADLDDADLDDVDLDDVDLDDDDLVDDDFKLDLNDMDLDPDDHGSDEDALVEDMSENDSDIELDPEDLKDLQKLDSGEEVQGWAPDAFDDRPISGEGPALPPPPAPLPVPSKPKGRPQVPTAAGSQRGKVVKADSRGDLDIPGDVFEENISDLAAVKLPGSKASNRRGKRGNDPVPLSPSDAEKLFARESSGRQPKVGAFDPDDPGLRKAFEEAFEEAKERAWQSFLERLEKRS